MQKGIGGSAGYGVGRVVIISNSKPEYVVKTVTDTEAEVKRYEAAAETFEKRTQEMAIRRTRVTARLPSSPKEPPFHSFSSSAGVQRRTLSPAAVPLTGMPKRFPCAKFHMEWIAAAPQMLPRQRK